MVFTGSLLYDIIILLVILIIIIVLLKFLFAVFLVGPYALTDNGSIEIQSLSSLARLS